MEQYNMEQHDSNGLTTMNDTPAVPKPTLSKRDRIIVRILIPIAGVVVLWSLYIIFVGFMLPDAAREGDTAFIRQQLDRGADVNLTDPDTNASLLDMAAQNGHTNTVQMLLDRGADINAKDEWGTTPLMSAIANDDPTTVMLLIRHGADLDCQDKDGNTALGEAKSDNDSELIKVLEKAGAKE